MDNIQTNGALAGIAIIGVAGRFPGAETIEQFWQNLRDGVESISFFADDELVEEGIDASLLENPNYVKAGGILEDADLFDAAFFGYTPREAELLDPQQRIFLESAWEALENAGYDPAGCDVPVGVYAGASLNTYFLNNLLPVVNHENSVDQFQAMISSDKDFLTTRLSYKLNLSGPSLDVQTACSTSLVAVQLACQSLLNYECDMALAGGVSIMSPQKSGYLYEEGMIMSPDGHCRAFDADAQGMVAGQGVGIVVLKRLAEAVEDGDHIYAVIKGAAVNNDGSDKIGYTAPSVNGQIQVIAVAQALAEIDAGTISYLETHGTGTSLGDPIEITALTSAFRLATEKRNFCAIGSVKTNIGHLDAAAGVAGLIKTTLALKNKEIPPSLNFSRPNPKIDFDNSPFYVNTSLREWRTEGFPRRAGVSSFGIGGTNAHVVLEEASTVRPSGASRPWQLLCLSAKTDSALRKAGQNLAAHLASHTQDSDSLNLADVAYTLHVGRSAFDHRQFVVCSDVEDAASALESADQRRVYSAVRTDGERPVVFMFTGQGAQHVNMGLGLYQNETLFREQVDFCAEFLKPHLGLDLRDIIYPASGHDEKAARRLTETSMAQPALFVLEYALARLWGSWGIEPQAMIGHSIGEYVAACLSGVFSLEDALMLVAARGRLMQRMPGGAMLAVSLPPHELRPYLEPQLEIAVVNGPSLCVVSGTAEAIDGLEARLSQEGITCRRLHTSHAFHSQMMDPILEPFTEQVKRVRLQSPQIPFVSNLTGGWISAAEATDPAYWARHLRETVSFSEGVGLLLSESDRILLEVGPSNTLSSLARRHPAGKAAPTAHTVLSSLRHPQEQQSDVAFVLNTLGRLWLAGAAIDWKGFYGPERRRRVPLPSYPFERQRYWIEPRELERQGGNLSAPTAKRPDIADWFYLPSWKRSLLPQQFGEDGLVEEKLCWLVFLDSCGVGSKLTKRLKEMNQDVITVVAGEQFREIGANCYEICPREEADYSSLIKGLVSRNSTPDRIVHLWSVTPDGELSRELEQLQDNGLYSLVYLARACGQQSIATSLQLDVVSNQLQEVTGEERLCPEKATILGPCKVIPVEYPHISCRSIDIALSGSGSASQAIIEPLLTELTVPSSDQVVAYRGHHRWVQTFEPIRLTSSGKSAPRLRTEGTYLITGGMGGMGLAFAEYLAESVRARLILTGRSSFLARDDWEQWLLTHDEQDEISRKIKKFQRFEEMGARVLLFSADVSDEEQMQAVINQAVAKFGPISGVIHTAGVADYEGVIQRRTRETIDDILAPKVKGTLVLETLFQDSKLDFFVLCSTLGSILYNAKFGQVGYSAANEFLDAFAYHKQRRDGTFAVAINWDDWREVGMSVEAVNYWDQMHDIDSDVNVLSNALTPAEGVEVFRRVLEYSFPRVVVSAQKLTDLMEQDMSATLLDNIEKKVRSSSAHQRPELSTSFVAPSNDIEQSIAGIWQELLGIDQIGIYDDFFELGGHSLLGARVISRLREQIQVEFSFDDFFHNPTISDQALLVTQRKAAQADEQQLLELLAELEELPSEQLDI